MKVIVQRVKAASVSVDGQIVSSIGKGLCVLVGIARQDTQQDADFIARKLLNVKLFDNDQQKRWAHNVKDKNYELLCISQFTLHCTLKKNKPDFHNAMAAAESKELYNDLLQLLKTQYHTDKIKDGVFGAYMDVNIQNDGPVTINIESPSEKVTNQEDKQTD